jgi:hypothetical protein
VAAGCRSLTSRYAVTGPTRRSFLAAVTSVAGGYLTPRLCSAGQLGDKLSEDDPLTQRVRLKLVGGGLYYYKLFVKVAAATLYLDERARSAEVLADVAKRLEMQYFRNVRAEDLVAGSAAVLSRNLSSDEYSAVRPQIELMHGLYQNVSPGDRSALMYVPGVGTSLQLNGAMLGTVPGSEFASAYFSIWFGPRPIDEVLKRRLLGGN